MDKIFIIKNRVVELKDGQLVKSAIELPNNTEHLTVSFDYKIIALCREIDTEFVLIS